MRAILFSIRDLTDYLSQSQAYIFQIKIQTNARQPNEAASCTGFTVLALIACLVRRSLFCLEYIFNITAYYECKSSPIILIIKL